MGKIRKSLTNLLRSTALASSMAIPLVFGGCCKENYPPEAKLEVSPLSGEAPLPIRMKVTGTDVDGVNDIYWYNLNVNNQNIKRRYPIDTTITFPNSGIVKVYGEVSDSKNQTDRTPVSSIEVYGKPFIEQSASLFEDVKIKYDATLFRVPEADLIINKNGIQFLTKKISDINPTGTDYQKTFTNALDGITKGNYEFVLKAQELEKRDTATIPNYKPTVGSITPVNFLEETDTTITLPSNFQDKNPEDVNNIAYQSVTSDLKTKATLLPENKLKIEGLPGKTGSYQIKIKFGSTAGGLEEAVLQGQIIEDTRIEINPFVQPNNKDLNWYGSGDVNNDNAVNGQDLTLLNRIINENYLDPSDTRLKDRADVNGDGVVDSQDKQLLEYKLNNPASYLPGDWNKLQTRAEREDWLRKMLAIDKTSELSLNESACLIFSDQTYINFNGFKKIEDISGLLQDYPSYDLSDNGRFNLPLYEVVTQDYDSNGNFIGGHAMNIIILGNSTLNCNDQSNVEPQTDKINVQQGEDYLIGMNSKFYIRGSNGARIDYIKYNIKDKIPTLTWINPNVKIITQRGK